MKMELKEIAEFLEKHEGITIMGLARALDEAENVIDIARAFSAQTHKGRAGTEVWCDAHKEMDDAIDKFDAFLAEIKRG